MPSKSPSTGALGLNSVGPYHTRSRLPLYLLQHGSALVGFGILFGFIVPLTPYPRLGLTAHIQFCIEGTMVVAAGLVLQSDPFTNSHESSDEAVEKSPATRAQPVMLAERLSWLQRKAIYWGCASIWVALLSEVANAWWGTQWLLTLAHQAAGLQGTPPAAYWMEMVVSIAHKSVGVLLAIVWPTILYSLFQ